MSTQITIQSKEYEGEDQIVRAGIMSHFLMMKM